MWLQVTREGLFSILPMANNVSQPLAKHKYLIIERQQCKLIRVVAPILYLEWYHIVRDTIRGARPGLQRKLCQYPIILKSRLQHEATTMKKAFFTKGNLIADVTWHDRNTNFTSFNIFLWLFPSSPKIGRRVYHFRRNFLVLDTSTGTAMTPTAFFMLAEATSACQLPIKNVS